MPSAGKNKVRRLKPLPEDQARNILARIYKIFKPTQSEIQQVAKNYRIATGNGIKYARPKSELTKQARRDIFMRKF